MKNANVFVDVDLTLVDANKKLLPGATEALAKLATKVATCFFGQPTARITPAKLLICII
jgi:hydroxymethylpyrimidine pyrophosphatase-like HAD family hydrolase